MKSWQKVIMSAYLGLSTFILLQYAILVQIWSRLYLATFGYIYP